jgi:hypothetical protein
MSRNGTGSYSLPAGNPVTTGTTISSTWANNTLSDIASALTSSVAKDGQTTMTGNLPMGGFKVTGLAAPTVAGDALTYGENAYVANLELSGTGRRITGDFSNATVSNRVIFQSSSANLGTSVAAIPNGAASSSSFISFASSDPNNGSYFALNAFFAENRLTGGCVGIGTYAPMTFYTGGSERFRIDTDGTATFTGNVIAPTQAAGDNSTKVATTAFVASAAPQLLPISASVAASALTISASALSLDFRSATLGSGTVTRVIGTPASLAVPSTATLGTISATQSRLVVLALNNAGTIELAVVNIAGGNDLTETGLISTTAISAAATASNVVYSNTARTSVAYRVIGYVESTQATAGTWATAPSTIQGYGGQALSAMSSLGYGQTWQNVTGSRTFGTTYYNTTGKPVTLAVTANSAGSGAGIIFLINGVTVYSQAVSATALSGTGGGTFIVPVGVSYSITSAGTLAQWWELR